MIRMRWQFLVMVIVVLSVSVAPVGAVDVHYRPPTDAPIVDHFRPPATFYGGGNRGLEYATQSGSIVRASGDGTVAFAGPVAGRLVVSVTHGDGLRTTYSGLEALRVRRGEVVARGQTLGLSTDRLHFGVLAGRGYLDPEHLFDRSSQPVRLVPVVHHARPHHRTIVNPVNSWLSLGVGFGRTR